MIKYIFLKMIVILFTLNITKVVEAGSKVKDFKPADRVVVPAITPDWNTLEIQNRRHQHSGGMLASWKLSNIKDGVFTERFMLMMSI